MQRLGFVVVATTSAASAPGGTVVGTTPPSGETAPPHATVRVVVSAGPAVAVPDKPKGAKGNGKDRQHGHGNQKAK